MKAGSYFLPHRWQGDSLRPGSHQGSRRGRRAAAARGSGQGREIPYTLRPLSQGGWTFTELKNARSPIKSGACDGLGENRATLFGLVDKALSRAASIASDRLKGQTSLFGEMDDSESIEVTDADRVEDWPKAERLAAEKELLGFYVSGHPLNPFSPILKQYGLGNTESVATLPDRSMTRIGGMISAIQQGFSKKSGKPYAMITLEDLQGQLQILCMNDQYDKHRHLFEANRTIMVIGEVNNAEDRPKIFPQEIMDLEEAPKRFSQQIHLRLSVDTLTTDSLDAIMALVKRHKGSCPPLPVLHQTGWQHCLCGVSRNVWCHPRTQLSTRNRIPPWTQGLLREG